MKVSELQTHEFFTVLDSNDPLHSDSTHVPYVTVEHIDTKDFFQGKGLQDVIGNHILRPWLRQHHSKEEYNNKNFKNKAKRVKVTWFERRATTSEDMISSDAIIYIKDSFRNAEKKMYKKQENNNNKELHWEDIDIIYGLFCVEHVPSKKGVNISSYIRSVRVYFLGFIPCTSPYLRYAARGDGSESLHGFKVKEPFVYISTIRTCLTLDDKNLATLRNSLGSSIAAATSTSTVAVTTATQPSTHTEDGGDDMDVSFVPSTIDTTTAVFTLPPKPTISRKERIIQAIMGTLYKTEPTILVYVYHDDPPQDNQTDYRTSVTLNTKDAIMHRAEILCDIYNGAHNQGKTTRDYQTEKLPIGSLSQYQRDRFTIHFMVLAVCSIPEIAEWYVQIEATVLKNNLSRLTDFEDRLHVMLSNDIDFPSAQEVNVLNTIEDYIIRKQSEKMREMIQRCKQHMEVLLSNTQQQEEDEDDEHMFNLMCDVVELIKSKIQGIVPSKKQEEEEEASDDDSNSNTPKEYSETSDDEDDDSMSY